ncbi:hypothetical protein [Devosia sp. SL43]|uniref:hypothetical protein n=1 Tax=Devosia sp. SL43 TaxID=2806348 RepID=UPI001F380BC6|nr:hypothetical protein [Devosia sp. SL43]UJW87900.1 hypothetical protein IM737_04395 [Devosia sp. SL43]
MAVIGPTPGIVITRLAITSSRARRAISRPLKGEFTNRLFATCTHLGAVTPWQGGRGTADVGTGFRTLLLLRPSERMMMPLSTQAFQQTQGSRRKLRARCADTLIIDRDGKVQSIADIEFLGAFDRTPMPLLLHWFFGVGGIRVAFREEPSHTLSSVKQLIQDCLQGPHSLQNWGTTDPAEEERFAEGVQRAESFQQLFKALRLPRPDKALDLL